MLHGLLLAGLTIVTATLSLALIAHAQLASVAYRSNGRLDYTGAKKSSDRGR